jgi:hypothetical protein
MRLKKNETKRSLIPLSLLSCCFQNSNIILAHIRKSILLPLTSFVISSTYCSNSQLINMRQKMYLSPFDYFCMYSKSFHTLLSTCSAHWSLKHLFPFDDPFLHKRCKWRMIFWIILLAESISSHLGAVYIFHMN